jgi:hypothetical protein
VGRRSPGRGDGPLQAPAGRSRRSSHRWVAKQAGYSIADILAKALYGLLIYKIARTRSFADDAAFQIDEIAHDAR